MSIVHRMGLRSEFTQRVIVNVLLALTLSILCYSQLQATTIDKGLLEISLSTIYKGSNSTDTRVPVTLRQPVGENSNQLFVASAFGKINIVNAGPPSTFLDISDETIFGTETGLLGMAFHPGFSNPSDSGYHKLYTLHSVETDPNATVTFSIPDATVTHQNVLTEWQVDSSNPDIVDMSSRRELYRESHALFGNHNAGALDFGPDGYLYISVGEPASFSLFTQQLDKIQGKILRIDPLAPEVTPGSLDPVSSNGNYRIPSSNPFVSDPNALGEVFAYGFRNPFRMSVDPTTGVVFVGDVGGGRREEVNAVFPGLNYGWPYREGDLPGPITPPDPEPESVLPVADYVNFSRPDGDGRAMIGGFVYRGSIPELQGKYVFGDLSYGAGPYWDHPGRLFWIDPYDELGELKDPSEIEVSEFRLSEGTCSALASTAPFGGGCEFDITVFGFGVDNDGEIYILGEEVNRARIYKITGADFVTPGDFDRDGDVDEDDLAQWQGDFGLNGSSDADNDGDSDGIDFLEWQRHHNDNASAAPVPEPAASGLLCGGILLVLGQRRNGRSRTTLE